MTTKSLLRPKERGEYNKTPKNADPSVSKDVNSDIEREDDFELEDENSDGSYVPQALKKLMKYRTKNSRRKLKSRERQFKLGATGLKSKRKRELAKVIDTSRKSVPYKEEASIQKAALNPAETSIPDMGRRKSRKSVVDILMDPNMIQKEAEELVVQMHKEGRDLRVAELNQYLEEVNHAIQELDYAVGASLDDIGDTADLAPDLGDDEDEDEDSKNMDAQAMRTMLTALAGREAKEDAVASVANIGASWRTIPHDQLNCCLSMDPKMMDDHRRRVKKNYEQFDNIFRPRKKEDAKKNPLSEEENEETLTPITGEEEELQNPKEEKQELTKEEPVNFTELTREQMLEVHDKIGPWVHQHTKKLDKFIESRKYTPQYLLNHWNGELSDDDSEVDFEKYRSAWEKKSEGQMSGEEGSTEGQPVVVQPEEKLPTLQENNWFLFPTPMTRSYSTDTDEQGWDGERSRPFSQVAMEGLVTYLKRQQEEEKSRKFLSEYPWPPPSRYPPEVVQSDPPVKLLGHDGPDEDEDDAMPT